MTMTGLLQWSLAGCLAVILLAYGEKAQARTQPVYNIADKPIQTATGSSLTLEEVGNILASAARYKPESYSMTYRDSEVLKYDGTKIHRNYNKWIKLIEQVADERFASK